MSEVSQGHGWWMASDRKWYPPETVPVDPPPPFPEEEGSGNNVSGSKPTGSRKKWVVVPAIGGIVLALAITTFAVWPMQSKSTHPSMTSAAREYLAALNKMIQNIKMSESMEQSPNPATAKAGFAAEVFARQKFDSAVRAIKIPNSAKSDVQRLLARERSLESVLRTAPHMTKDVRSGWAQTPLSDEFVALDISNIDVEVDLSIPIKNQVYFGQIWPLQPSK